MLTLEDVIVEQGGFRLAASFQVEAGARVAVIGPSGAGKSTLLAAIGGFVPLKAGSVRWRGDDLTQRTPGKRPISTLFQDGNLFPHLTAAQNVGLGQSPSLRLTPEQKAKVAGALARVGLAGFEDRKPGYLSGGQQARVALARVMISARPILCLDEAFGALGPALRAEMLDLLAEVLDETGATLVMVTHEPKDARRVCPLSVLVADGQALAPVATEELLKDPPDALRAYLGGARS